MAYKGNIARLLDYPFTQTKPPATKKKVNKVSRELKIYRNRGTLPTISQLSSKYKIKESTATRLLQEIKREIKKRNLIPRQAGTPINIDNENNNSPNEVVAHDLQVADRVRSSLDGIRSRYAEEIKLRGEQTSISEGFVYLVTHCLFGGWVKAGMTVDYELRIDAYNVSDPLSLLSG